MFRPVFLNKKDLDLALLTIVTPKLILFYLMKHFGSTKLGFEVALSDKLTPFFIYTFIL
jgi:hypothetical protein